jgi:SAM-dependent methyltransferase
MLLDDIDTTHDTILQSTQVAAEWRRGRRDDIVRAAPLGPADIDDFVQGEIAATNGYMYRSLIGRLRRYPIPHVPLEAGSGRSFLDVGCNWGRWCFGAARQGYRAIGIDPSIRAIFAARRVARQLGVEARFVVADGRFVPFREGLFDVCFSYSVLQHFSKPNATRALTEIGRVLRPGGTSLVQLPNRYGLRNVFHQVRAGFKEAPGFGVRYWSPSEIRTVLTKAIGTTRIEVDGFFTLDAQPTDLDLLRPEHRLVVRASEGLKRLSRTIHPLAVLADSLYANSTRSRPLVHGASRGAS